MIHADFCALPTRLQDKICIEPNSGCWLWTGCLDYLGYSVVFDPDSHRKRPKNSGHAMIFRLSRGIVPEGMELHHVCKTRCCCNPLHLTPIEKKAHRFLLRQLTCRRGHPWNDTNAALRPADGARICRVCRRLNHHLRVARAQSASHLETLSHETKRKVS
jgi:hypothetical protein